MGINLEKKITRALLKWSNRNQRGLPWKQTKDPYQIWVSEIILQQTRVEQGTPYYHRFIERFPNLLTLAKAPEDDLMKIWEGLGYYRRARYMLETARHILQKCNGIFPRNYAEIRALKGVGDYTAAAIASFAFDLPYPVIDGNVTRVVSRIFAIETPIDKKATMDVVKQKTGSIFDLDKPSAFNQAIMDFGSLICTPINPACQECPISSECLAYKKNLIAQIPSKSRAAKKKQRYFYYLVPNEGDSTYIRKRTAKDIWQNLYEFFLIERDKPTEWIEIIQDSSLPVKSTISYPMMFTQILSHQKIHASFLEVNLSVSGYLTDYFDFTLVKRKKIRNFAFPQIIGRYLKEKDVILYQENTYNNG